MQIGPLLVGCRFGRVNYNASSYSSLQINRNEEAGDRSVFVPGVKLPGVSRG